MGLKRPKLTKRESSAPASSAPSSAPTSVPHANVEARGGGINVAELNRALGLGGGGSASALGSSGISTGDLGYALSAGNAGNNRSAESTRHTSYPLTGDLNGLPAKAGTRRGPRTTSYRIPLQRSAHSNIYDSVN